MTIIEIDATGLVFFRPDFFEEKVTKLLIYFRKFSSRKEQLLMRKMPYVRQDKFTMDNQDCLETFFKINIKNNFKL
jgi:hypothetical protein